MSARADAGATDMIGLAPLAAVATIVVGGELVAAGLLKFARAPATASTLGRRPGLRVLGALDGLGLRALGALELVVGVGIWALWWPARVAGAALLLAFAAWQVRALASGRAGTPCPCFGAATTVSRAGAVHVGVIALLAGVLALTPAPSLAVGGWLAVLVGLLALTCAALAWIAYSLAREVAFLRARERRRGALEIEAEGPARGTDCPLIERFGVQGSELALAVFLSPGCRMCAELGPAIAALAERPGLELIVFDEERDVLAWRVAEVPGSPYAVAMSADGIVLAKGTFNTAEQLQSIPGTALWRRAAEGAGV